MSGSKFKVVLGTAKNVLVPAENSICAIRDCGYVARMDLKQFLPLLVVLGVGTVFVWRSSSPKKHDHDCHCGCEHEPPPENPKDKAGH